LRRPPPVSWPWPCPNLSKDSGQLKKGGLLAGEYSACGAIGHHIYLLALGTEHLRIFMAFFRPVMRATMRCSVVRHQSRRLLGSVTYMTESRYVFSHQPLERRIVRHVLHWVVSPFLSTHSPLISRPSTAENSSKSRSTTGNPWNTFGLTSRLPASAPCRRVVAETRPTR
jgi:hypothetical protein